MQDKNHFFFPFAPIKKVDNLPRYRNNCTSITHVAILQLLCSYFYVNLVYAKYSEFAEPYNISVVEKLITNENTNAFRILIAS